MIVFIIAGVISALLLLIIWLLEKMVSRRASRTRSSNNEYDRLHEHLRNQRREIRGLNRVLIDMKRVSTALLVVGFSFFFVGGISSSIIRETNSSAFTDPGGSAAIFGWSLFLLAWTAILLIEGMIAILVDGIVARSVPLFTKERFITGAEAKSFGFKRILFGIGFLALFVFFIFSFLML